MTEVLSRATDADPGSPNGPRHARGGSSWYGAWARPWLLVGVLIVVVLGAAALVAFVFWPRLSLRQGSTGLATVGLGGAVGRLETASAVVQGQRIVLVDRDGQLVPDHPLLAGRPATVTVTAAVPGWLSWLAGGTVRATARFDVPAARVDQQVVLVRPGARPTLRFTQPVTLVRWSSPGGSGLLQLTRPTTDVTVGPVLASGGATDLTVAGFLPWVANPPTSQVTVFAGQGAMAYVTPAPGSSDLQPGEPILVRFSKPVTSLLGDHLPVVTVAKAGTHPAGRWQREGTDTLAFVPAPGAIWPNQTIEIRLPAQVRLAGGEQDQGGVVTLSTIPGSVLRAQQLLASLGYLPVTWSPAPGQSTPTTLAQEDALATNPPAGSFGWRWANTPAGLQALWVPGSDTVMTRGAIMNFEHVEGLNPVGFSNPLFWPTLAQAALSDKVNPDGYSWVDVTESLPEQLVLWHDGQVVLTSLANTGIPQSPTALGTYPVYLRYRFQIMRGLNPDGTPYADPVHWISYFNGGDAVHGFVRAAYGFPQSLGCVELPVPTAKVVWPYLHIGSLVTVQSQPLSV